MNEIDRDVLESLPAQTQEDLHNRFSYHRPSARRADEHQEVREICLGAAASLTALLPPGREFALVLTKLEEAMFWANAAIARQGEQPAAFGEQG